MPTPVVLLAAAAVVGALWWAALRARLLLPIQWVFGGGVLLVVGATALTTPDPVAPPASRPLPQADDGYVGSAACRACHPGEHASWHGSFHRTMTQVASRDTVAPRFEQLDLDWFGTPVRLEWRGDVLWTRFQRAGRDPMLVERPIEQLTGSHHLQVLWYSTGKQRELAPLPLAWKFAEQLWLPLSTVFVLPPEFRDPPEPGAWNQVCIMCHTTHAEPRVDVGKVDSHVGELGIACEACHGPGERHVAANRDPIRRYTQRWRGADDTMHNPATMPRVLGAQVCGQCHAVSILRQQHFDGWRDHGSPFRPGLDLAASHLVIGSGDRDAPELRRELQKNPNFFASSFWSDGQVRLSGREWNGVKRSPCHTHGDAARQLDCVVCHELHPDDGEVTPAWRSGQLRDAARDNRGCTQCHPALAEPAALAAHTHHAPGSAGSHCYDCHMPHTSVGLMKASRSHEITSPDVQVELATGRPNACNLCHLDRSLGWTAAQLAARWQRPAPALDREQQDVAAGVRWLLAGDAGLRLLAVWAAGQPAAQRTAGTDWLPPYLARLLDDPYPVVRFAAARSLRSLAGYDAAVGDYQFLAAPEALRAVATRVTTQWELAAPAGPRPAVLLGERGLDRTTFAALYARRDDRPVYLAE
jgi:hypothetical protein